MSRWNSRTHRIGPRTLEVVETSITELDDPVDAIVSSDDNRLTHAGGVSHAIWTAAGPALHKFIETARPVLGLGDVFVSPAGDLEARLLLHAVTVDYDANRAIGLGEIAQLYRRVIATAEEAGCSSLAVPLLATGAAHLTVPESTRGLAEALDAWLSGPTALKRISVVAIGRRFEAAADVVDRVASTGTDVDTLVNRLTGASSLPDRGTVASCWHRLSEPSRPEHGAILSTLFDATAQVSAIAILQSVGGAVNALLGDSGRSVAPTDMLDAVHSRSSAEVLEFLPTAAQLTGIGSPDQLKPLLKRGALARNRLAHQPYTLSLLADRDALFEAVRGLLILTAAADGFDVSAFKATTETKRQALESVGFPMLAERDGLWEGVSRLESRGDDEAKARRQRRRRRAAQASALPTESSPATQVPTAARVEPVVSGGTEHVRRLHEFLLMYLAEQEQLHLDQRLQQQGYQGDATSRLLEHCISVADPAEFVSQEFSRPTLDRAYLNTVGMAPAPGKDGLVLAQEIVEYLGFPKRTFPSGLRAVLHKIEQRRHAIKVSQAGVVRAAVGDVSRDLEFVCIVMIRFLCQAAFRQPAEVWLRSRRALTNNQELGKVGLGTMLSILGQIDGALDTDESAFAHLFTDSVQRRKLFPPETSGLTAVRNSFTHYHEHEAAKPLQDLRADALGFLDRSKAFLEYLRVPEGRLFPRIIRVDGVRLDQWGRKTIEAIDDEGIPHTVFTDLTLEPGRIYFMHPTTNPIRVDPILIPAGDLAWPEVT
jgi:O-acetyl-ADP-ribose deacetylase (regulator of RNase III)